MQTTVRGQIVNFLYFYVLFIITFNPHIVKCGSDQIAPDPTA